MKKMIKQAKGITLIALVVTIVILLILTGVTLKLSIGDNSILARATQASKDTKKAQIKEQMGLDFGESQIELNEDANKSYEEIVCGMMEKIKEEGVIGFNDIREDDSELYNSDKMTISLNAQIEKDNKYYNTDVTVNAHLNFEENSKGPVIDNIDFGDLTEIDSVDYANIILFEYIMDRMENGQSDLDYETNTAKLIYRSAQDEYYIGPTAKISRLGPVGIGENSIFYNKIDNNYYELVDYFTMETSQTFMKKVNLYPMTIKVNSGDDKNVCMNLGSFKGEINWGDGQKEQVDHLVSSGNHAERSFLPSKKIASISNKFKIAEQLKESQESYIAEHTYDEANKEYEIQINGICPKLRISDSGSYSEAEDTINQFEKVISVEEWGSLGSIYISFEGCRNLANIPEPTEETFKFALTARGMFANCKALALIPENLFKWNKYTVDYSGTFYGCEGLTSIPTEIFDDNINIIEFMNSTFACCTNLTGEAPRLWEHVRSGRGRIMTKSLYSPFDDDEYANKFPDGYRCFYEDTNLSNYDEIPNYWKGNIYK